VGTWEVQKSGVTDTLRAVTFLDDKVGIAVGDKTTILKTADGGKTWKPLELSKDSGNLIDLHFTDAKLGHVLTTTGVQRTTDGGKSWTFLGELKVPDGVRVGALSFPSAKHGWVVGDKGWMAHYEQ
jgi:photosystem II stability/assembly factor-like uncharacterized protein